MKISLVVDNDGEKQKVTIAESVYILEGITALPEIEIQTEKSKDNTISGTININIREDETAFGKNLEKVKVFIRNNGKIIFEKSVSELPAADAVRYSFKYEAADWEKDVEAVVSYYDKNIDRTVEVCGMFDPNISHDPQQPETIGAEGYSYDDNYHITLK